jgi:methionine synthase II (cobalamin-independent)
MTNGYVPQGAHLVGSVALSSSEEVFRSVAETMPQHVRRIPDGETGERINWIAFQFLLFQNSPQMELAPATAEFYGPPGPRLRIRAGVDPAEVELGRLGYADAAIDSYRTFRRLKDDGVLPGGTKLLVSLPTPVASVILFITPENQVAFEEIYERAMLAEVDEIVAAIPSADLAIQWDCNWEVSILENLLPPYWDGDPMGGALDRMVRVTQRIPAEVEVGHHLCYGDYKGKHFVEPRDTAGMVGMANTLHERVSRPIQWLHMPVPIDRNDDAYFRPLDGLRMQDGTEVYLGLVHPDGLDANRRRVAAAAPHLASFGVATECGLGRRPPAMIRDLMALHAQLSAPWADLGPSDLTAGRDDATAAAERPDGALLVGSVPLAGPDHVFRAAASVVGDRLRRVPDGETGERSIWIVFQLPLFAEHPALEPARSEDSYTPLPVFRRRRDFTGDIEFGELGYAANAQASYAEFRELKEADILPPHVRFQVSLPTPLAPVNQFTHRPDIPALEAPYERALMRELDGILDAIPAEDLAIQWDVAHEMGMIEGLDGLFQPWFDDVESGLVERLVKLADAVPASVEVGYHFCYGDFDHRHFVQPADLRNCVTLANGLIQGAGRPVTWLHMPVPQDRDDAAYFEPLADLNRDSFDELYLGLVHMTDGLDGSQRRIAVARRFVDRFGVATECGMGRRPVLTIGPLLRLHRQLAEPVTDVAALSAT